MKEENSIEIIKELNIGDIVQFKIYNESFFRMGSILEITKFRKYRTFNILDSNGRTWGINENAIVDDRSKYNPRRLTL